MFLGNYLKKINKKYFFHKFTGFSFNSNEIKRGNIFFAIKGTKTDGRKFIKFAIKNGAKTIVSNLKYKGFKKDILYLNNKNPSKLLASLSAKFFKLKPKNIIAVTGTNGKSSIVNFYYQILKLNHKKVGSIGTLGIFSNSSKKKSSNTTLDSISIHKTLNSFKKNGIDNVILEASSHGLKQYRLHGIKFRTAIFSNFSRDHLDYHKTYKDYLDSKLILFKELLIKNALAIYDHDINEAKILSKIASKKKLIKCLIGQKNEDFRICSEKVVSGKTEITFVYKKKQYFFKTLLIGSVQIKNLMMAIIAANKSGLKLDKIINSIKNIKPVNGRMEQIGNIYNNSKVILDYAHTPDALETCLKNVKQHFKSENISVVFGCGGERDKQKRKLMGKIANSLCKKIYITDDNPRNENPRIIRNQIKKEINKKKIIEIPSRKLAIEKSIKALKSGELLVIAGRGHENYQQYKNKIRFSDRMHINLNIKLKNKSLSKNWKINIIKDKIPNYKISNNLKIKNLSIDSKNIRKNDIFIGIKGKKYDGNSFANESIKKGASLAIIDRNYGPTIKRKLKVKNSLIFLADCAALIREVSNIQAVAITGSTGKTSLKDLVGNALNKIQSTTFSKKSFNNKYGVPISLFNINKKNKFGIFEVGMNKAGEIYKLTKIIKPNLGVITNISYAHIKNFKNLYGIAKAKSELIDNIVSDGTIVLNMDDAYFNYFKSKANKKKINIISYSRINKKADIRFLKLKKIKKKYEIKVKIYSKIYSFKLNNDLKFYIDNILATIAVVSYFTNIKNLKKNIFQNYKIPQGRGNFFKIKFNNSILNIFDESYNSNPLSLNFAINKFNDFKTNSKKFLLLGDMLELGKYSIKLHKDAANIINKSNISKVYVYGNYIKNTFNNIKKQKKGRILKSRNDLKIFFKKEIKDKSYLMIKGSNATGLNLITKQLKLGKINAL